MRKILTVACAAAFITIGLGSAPASANDPCITIDWDLTIGGSITIDPDPQGCLTTVMDLVQA